MPERKFISVSPTDIGEEGDTVSYDSVNDIFTYNFASTRVERITLSSSQILNSNSSPIEILDAPGANKTNIIVSIIADCSFLTTAYSTNTNARIYQTGSSTNIGLQNNFLGFTSDQLTVILPISSGSRTEQYVKNQKTFYQTTGGDPTAGDGSITLTIFYIKVSH
jgi:hypothetical protein